MENKQEYYRKKLKTFETFLNRWQNVSARIWEYRVSHTIIVIRLESSEVKGNLHIIGIEPIYYKGLFKWDNCKIKIEYDETFKIIDEVNGIELQCSDIEIKENCKPIF